MTVPVRDDLVGVVPYGAPQRDVAVRLNTNETPYPPTPAFTERLAARIADLSLHRYPDRRAWELRSALGEREGLAPERVWVAKGSNEVLSQLFTAYGGAGRRLLLFTPGYSAHPLIAKVSATPVVTADLDDDLGLSPERAAEAAGAADPDIVCIANPINPVGTDVGLDAVRALHDATRGLVIVDEAYVEFGGTSARGLLDVLDRLVVCRTFSKAWRLAGLRLGYLLAHDWVIDDLRRVRLPYHVDSLTQAAGLTALELADEMTAHVGDICAERDRVAARLHQMGVTTWPSSGNFLLARMPIDGAFDALVERGVLVRDMSSVPRLERCVRITIGTPDEDDAALAAIEELL